MSDPGASRADNQPSAGDATRDEVELLPFVLGLWRRRWLIVAVTILGTLVALLSSVARPRMYEARAKVLVPSLELGPGMQLTGSAFQAIAQSPDVASAVLREFRLDAAPFSLTTDEFRMNRLSVVGIHDTNLSVIMARLEDPDKVVQVANRVAELAVARVRETCETGRVKQYETTRALLEETQQRLSDAERRLDAIARGTGQTATTGDARPEWQRLTVEVEMLRARLSCVDLITRIEDITSRPARSFSQLRVFDRALPPGRPIETNTLRRTVVGGVAGYLVALLGVILVDAVRFTVLRRRPW